MPGPDVRLDPYKRYIARFVTERGTVHFDLFAKQSAALVNNFIFLATNKFYDKTKFHRVIEGFVIQGGDRLGTGEGGPGYYLSDELGKHQHTSGVLSMSNCGPNTNGSQFFMTLTDAPWLDPTYSVIGKLTSGADILPVIKQGDALLEVFILDGDAASLLPLSWASIDLHWQRVVRERQAGIGDPK